MSQSIRFMILLSVAVSMAFGQANQTCQHTGIVTPRHFFETDKALGTWYIQEIYTGLKVDATLPRFSCFEVTFARNANSSDPLLLTMEEKLFNLDSETTESYDSNVEISDEFPLEAIWKLTTLDGKSEADFVWLHTDYENWAVSYGCNVEDNYRRETLNVFSRSRDLDLKTWEILRTLAVGYGFPAENIRPINQASC